jgi:hypothetical protein
MLGSPYFLFKLCCVAASGPFPLLELVASSALALPDCPFEELFLVAPQDSFQRERPARLQEVREPDLLAHTQHRGGGKNRTYRVSVIVTRLCPHSG